MKTVNQFLKEMREIFGDIEYRAEKDGQVFKSKGWKDCKYKTESIPYTPPKMESVNGGKMSSLRSGKKAYK